MRSLLVLCAALSLASGALGTNTLADEYGAKAAPKVTGPKVAWVAVYLDAKSTDPKLGSSRGFTPAETKVHVGDHIVFLNIDDEVHTATVLVAGAFPSNAMKPMGHRISEVWSTGNLKANGESSPILADKVGRYPYGCIHHFAQGQKAMIVVAP